MSAVEKFSKYKRLTTGLSLLMLTGTACAEPVRAPIGNPVVRGTVPPQISQDISACSAAGERPYPLIADSRNGALTIRRYDPEPAKVLVTVAVEPGTLKKVTASNIDIINKPVDNPANIDVVIGKAPNNLYGVGIQSNFTPRENSDFRRASATIRNFDPSECNTVGFEFKGSQLQNLTVNGNRLPFTAR